MPRFSFFLSGLKLFGASLFFYSICNVGLLFYEKVKNETPLFLPVLAMSGALAVLRLLHPAKPRVSLYMVNLVLGISFAFLYVQLRRCFAVRYAPKGAPPGTYCCRRETMP